MRAVFVALKTFFFLNLLFWYHCPGARAQTKTILVVSPHVGEIIDQEEKARFNLFPFIETADFQIGRFFQLPDNAIVLEVIKKNGDSETRNYTQPEFDLTGQLIAAKAVNLQSSRPVAPPPTPTPSLPYPPARQQVYTASKKLTGKVYYVILTDGMKFFGNIVEKRPEEYVFATQYYGEITAPFRDIRYLKEVENRLHGDAYWIPNPHDSRLFFGPTGRGIPAGEGYLQSIYGYINAVNYGVTDNLSIGATFLLIPGMPTDRSIYALTPKISLPVSRIASLSAGVLYAKVLSTEFGIVYGAGTIGSKNDHLTIGLGYGFHNRELTNKPVIMIGGTTRVSNRLALMSENYVVTLNPKPDAFTEQQRYGGGLYGLRFIWPRTNLDLASFYYFYPPEFEGDPAFISYYVLPAYISFTYKIGHRKQVGKVF